MPHGSVVRPPTSSRSVTILVVLRIVRLPATVNAVPQPVMELPANVIVGKFTTSKK